MKHAQISAVKKMKSTAISALWAILACCILGSCTHNDGDIGPLFGQWAIDSCTVDGHQADVALDEYYFKFQTSVVQITVLQGNHQSYEAAGSWALAGDALTFDFDNHEAGGVNQGSYTPPAALGFPAGRTTVAKVEKLTGNTLKFSFVGISDKTYAYSLRKLN